MSRRPHVAHRPRLLARHHETVAILTPLSETCGDAAITGFERDQHVTPLVALEADIEHRRPAVTIGPGAQAHFDKAATEHPSILGCARQVHKRPIGGGPMQQRALPAADQPAQQGLIVCTDDYFVGHE